MNIEEYARSAAEKARKSAEIDAEVVKIQMEIAAMTTEEKRAFDIVQLERKLDYVRRSLRGRKD